VVSNWILGRKRYNRPNTYPTANTGMNERTEHHSIVDFKSAFDSVIREQLYATVLEMGIPMKLVKLTELH
jgi:hypothetical protein